uniref:Receptor ligand binding region domain-containing protein n=1 Tax=Strigamia maritima TaxID=126957 RepID=T1INP5_STRMM
MGSWKASMHETIGGFPRINFTTILDIYYLGKVAAAFSDWERHLTMMLGIVEKEYWNCFIPYSLGKNGMPDNLNFPAFCPFDFLLTSCLLVKNWSDSLHLTFKLIFTLFIISCAKLPLFLLGYITGSERRPNEHEYSRPGLSVSGAISLAIDEVNERHPIRDGNSLSFVVAETYGEEAQSILNTANLWTQNVSVYIGPQETCVHEARMAAAFNLPMISYLLMYCLMCFVGSSGKDQI